MFSMTLSAVGNPDHGEDPNNSIVNGMVVPTIKVDGANSILSLRKILVDYIDMFSLGSGNFPGAEVYEDDEYVGRFSYNSRFWEKDTEYGAE